MKILLLAIPLFLAADLKTELASLIEAERAFARLSVDKGQREAFLANLTDGSILFRPDPTPGKAWFQNNPAPTSQLSWEPAFADIAAAGDFGYTTGPWEIRRSPQAAPGGFGHYVTVWRKQPDGTWKIAIDIGISHAAAPKPKSVESPPLGAEIQKAGSAKEVESARIELMEAERRFPTGAESYVSALASDARLYRNGSFPFVNAAAVRAALANTKGIVPWKVAEVSISGSADLAYAYGTAMIQSENHSYLRIWKRQRDRSWKVVLDLLS